MASNPTSDNKFYFENLDGLRFFCFLSVFLYHSFHSEIPAIQQSAIFIFFKETLFGNGFLGVNFFFVLSGFLITYLLIKEKNKNGQIHIVHFWIRRILRIWPLYFACVFYGFVIFPYTKILAGGVPAETANPWYYIGFISNFDYIQKGLPDATGLGVLWSVAIEEQFYLAWPLILAFFPARKFYLPLILIIIGSLTFRAVNDVPILHELHTLSCIGDMALGGLGAWLILFSLKFKRIIGNLPKAFIYFIYAAYLFVFLFRDELMLSSYWMRVIERPIISLIMLIIILEQCFSQHSFFKMGNFKWPSKLGVVTYGLYCLHFIVISYTIAATKIFGLNNQVWQVVFLETLLALAITIVISLISYRFFEAPFLKFKDRFGFLPKKRSVIESTTAQEVKL